MEGLNLKGLVQQIKSNKSDINWTYANGINVITNLHWMIKFEFDIPHEVLATMLSIFAARPESGKNLSIFGGLIQSGDALPFRGVYQTAQKGKIARLTNIFQKQGNQEMQIVSIGDDLAFINSQYVKAVDAEYSGDILTLSGIQPIFFSGIDYVVLPYRAVQRTDYEIIGKLLGGLS